MKWVAQCWDTYSPGFLKDKPYPHLCNPLYGLVGDLKKNPEFIYKNIEYLFLHV